MVKPLFQASNHYTKRRPLVVVPPRYSINMTKAGKPQNSATKKIMSNFYHLTYDPTQQPVPSQQPTSSQQLVPSQEPIPSPPKKIIKVRDQCTSTEDLPVPSPYNQPGGIKKRRKSTSPRCFVRVKKSLLREMIQRIREQEAILKRIVFPDSQE